MRQECYQKMTYKYPKIKYKEYARILKNVKTKTKQGLFLDFYCELEENYTKDKNDYVSAKITVVIPK